MKFLWSILTLVYIRKYIDNKIELLLIESKIKRATFLFSTGTFIKLIFVFYAFYFIMSTQQDIAEYFYYMALTQEVLGVVICGLVFFSNYLKLKKRAFELKSQQNT